jgi:hypothetical protein
MPYKTKKVGNKTCVYKKYGGKRIGCTSGNPKKYLGALHTNVKENVIENICNEVLKETSIIIHNIDEISEKSLEYIIITETWKINSDIKADYVDLPHPQGGMFDQYSYVTKNLKQEDITFHNKIIYKNIKDILTDIELNNSNKKLINILNSKINKQLVTFKFIDQKNNLTITGEMGYYAKFVMDFVLSSIFDSLKRNKKKIIGFYYTILKSELKRIRFYDQIIQKVIKYKNKFIDVTSDDQKITIYYIF